jgi:hypothetical protein
LFGDFLFQLDLGVGASLEPTAKNKVIKKNLVYFEIKKISPISTIQKEKVFDGFSFFDIVFLFYFFFELVNIEL